MIIDDLNTKLQKSVIQRCNYSYLKYNTIILNIFQSVGKSLTFRGTVYEASELIKTHRCKDPICDTHLWKVKHELDMAR